MLAGLGQGPGVPPGGGMILNAEREEFTLTAIVVNYNTRDLLHRCIGNLRSSARAAGASLQVVVVDNASRDGSAELLRRDFADCEIVLNDTNVGFGRANNQALPLVRGRYLLLLNTDAFVAPDSIGTTVRYLDEHPRCGLLGVRLIGRDGSLQPSCRYFPTPWNEFLVRAGLAVWFPGTRLIDDMHWDHAASRACDWVPGCYYLVRKNVIDTVGLFDPRFFLYYEEVDHCRAVKAAGWEVIFFAGTTVVHIGGESARTDAEVTRAGSQIDALQIESGLLYHRKHHGKRGVAALMMLTAAGDALLALKALIKGRAGRELKSHWAHTLTTWRLLRRTGGGLVPTR